MSIRAKALRGSAWVGGSTGFLAIAQLLQLIALARILTPGEYGVIAILTIVLTFVEILMTAGISNAIIQRQSATEDELASLHWLNIALGIIVGSGVLVLAPALGTFFNSSAAILPISVLALAVPINACSQVPRACLEREMRFRDVALVESIAGALSVGMTILGSALLGLLGVAIGMVLGFLARTICFLFAGRGFVRFRAHFSLRETRRFISFGIYQLLNALVGFIDGSLATLMIGRMLSTVQLGGYNLAFGISVSIPGKLNPVVTRVMFPGLSKVQKDPRRFSDSSLSLITMTGLVNTPLLMVLVIAAEPISLFMFGEKWMWVVPLVQLLAISGFTRALANPLGIVLMARNQQRLGLIIAICKVAVSVPLLFVFVSIWNEIGAAIALGILGILTLVINHFLLHYLLRVSFLRILGAHLTPLLVGIPSLGLGLLAISINWPTEWLQALLVAAIVITSYVAVAWFSRVRVVREVISSIRA